MYKAREREHVWASIGIQGCSLRGGGGGGGARRAALYFTFFKQVLDKVQK